MELQNEKGSYPAFYAAFAGSIIVLVAALVFPVELPIGPSFWDTYIYIDGAYRLDLGQQIYVDFHPPVGPLNYVLFGIFQTVFPEGNVVFLIQWSMILVTAPLMAAICWCALERGTWTAFGLFIPYLVFSVLPFNVVNWNVFPGVDGFAYYNRHGAVYLYLLVASLFFVRTRAILIAVLSVLLLAMAFTKINAFVSAGLILFVAVLTRRIGWVTVVAVATVCLGLTAALEVMTGIVSGYLQSMLRLLDNNTGVLLYNLLLVGTQRFDVIISATLMAFYLLVCRWRGGENLLETFDRHYPRMSKPNRLDQDWIWLGVLIAANIFYESQNYGSVALISLWPFMVVLQVANRHPARASLPALTILVLLVCLPTFTKVIHSAVRAAATTIRDLSIDTPNFPPYMRMSAKQLTMQAATSSRAVMSANRSTYVDYAKSDILPSYWLYFDLRFQVNVLESMNEVIGAIYERETRRGLHYEVIDLRDFANPITAAMGRTPAKGISIGGDPFRAVLSLTDEESRMLSETDLVLIPTCPVTNARLKLLDLYAKAYEGFTRFPLTPCFDALENPKYAAR